MCESKSNVITVGTYVIIKKQSYKKLYKVTENGTLTIGKDKVEMGEIVGKPYWSTFEMVPNDKKNYRLRLAQHVESWDHLKGDLSGQDNRTITDDSTSQRLSKDEILQLQEAGKTGEEIIGSLIENSKSFATKTEYSQKKYIEKKKLKYFRFLIVCEPTITSLHEIYFQCNSDKIGRLRMDTLAQILSYSDVQSDGLYMLYDSGSQGLPAAAMLDRIGANTNGCLINLHPGNMPQIAIVQSMNFPQELKKRHIAVNIYSFLRLYYQGESSVLDSIALSKKSTNHLNKKSDDVEKPTEGLHDNINDDDKSRVDGRTSEPEITANEDSMSTVNNEECANIRKRKSDEPEDDIPVKKPRWLLETQRAVDLLENSKARSLTIIGKEHPLNIVTALLPFLGISRPFVIFHVYREPLQETYMELKQNHKVINLHLFTSFLRSYQVLPDRTHPDTMTDDVGGYILTGFLIE